MKAQVEPFYDPATGTVTYVVHAGPASACAIVDPVLDYDAASGRIARKNADRVIAFVRAHSLHVEWILETHAHADHLSAAAYLKRVLGGRVAIGERICEVQRTFKQVFNLNGEFAADGSEFDHLFADGEVFAVGDLQATAWSVPGHTPADIAYRVGDAVFVGDTMFMPDVGSARCDFPGGDAALLYRSIRRLLALPDDTALYMCHDYPPAHRSAAWQSTVREQRARNIHIHDGVDEAAFVAMREARDATLAMPNLILPAIQINIRAGHLPSAEANGTHYLKIPVDAF